MSVTQISAKALYKKLEENFKPFLLDVRESHEFEYAHIEGSQLIQMNQVSNQMSSLNATADCVVICHHGIRSQHVADFLDQSGFTNIYNLQGGIEAWSVDCDSTVLRY